MTVNTLVQIMALAEDLEARGVMRGVGKLLLYGILFLIVIGIVMGLLAGRLFRGGRSRRL
jgi:sulfur transfer complex TusBCD TusB component (DsrH family)